MSSNSSPGPSAGSSPEKGSRLRRPHPATLQRLQQNGVYDQNQNQGPVMPVSVLSAEAPEFIPKYDLIPQPQMPAQRIPQMPPQRLPQPPQMPAQAEALYEDFQRLVSIRPSHLTGVTTAGVTGPDSAPNMFKEAVFHLTTSPGNMEDYIRPVVDRLMQEVANPDILTSITETLFEQSISEPNFRFTGAKICKYLSNELRSHPIFNNFRSQFLNRCKKEFDEREVLLNSDVPRLCGLSMFFGEMFLVMEIERDGERSKMGILRAGIASLVMTCLSRLDDDLVKCATQLLKLTGTALMETKNTLEGNFDEIFTKIKTLERHPQLNKTSHCLVNSVLSCLESNFGVDQPPSPQKPMRQQSQQPCQASFQTNEPVFYDKNGQPITREEAGFCQDDSSDYVDFTLEEEEAFLQWEEENFANEQWNNQMGAIPPVQNGADGQQWSNQGDGQYNQPWSTGDRLAAPDYSQWSSNQDDPPYIYPEQNAGYPPDMTDMDDEMMADYEMFLQDAQHRK